MNILVLNAGSSSLKFELVETDRERMAADTDRRVAGGTIERIGGEGLLTLERAGAAVERDARPVRDHRAAWRASSTSGCSGGSAPSQCSPKNAYIARACSVRRVAS